MKAASSQDRQQQTTTTKRKAKKITYPYTLKAALADHTRDELKEMGDVLHIEIKSADKKQERVDKLYAGMTGNHRIERCLLCMKEEEWQLLGTLVSYETACPLDTDTGLPALAVNEYLGYDEDGHIVIPQEIKTCFQAVQNDEFQLRRQKMRWLQQCLAMAGNLYGIMPLHVLVAMYNRNRDFQSNALEINSMMQLIPETMRTYFIIAGLICDIQMTEENVLALMHDRTTNVYYIPAQSETENAAAGNIIYFNSAMVKQGMAELLKYTSLSKQQTLNVMGDIIDEMASGWSAADIIEEMQNMQITIRKGDKKRLQELFAEWNRCTKKWVNCGYSDEEMARRQRR